MDKHVRAKCPATGAIAALPERALELGHIKGWERADGPPPIRPKSRRSVETSASEHPTADSESANEKE